MQRYHNYCKEIQMLNKGENTIRILLHSPNSLPGKCADADQFTEVPQADQGISTAYCKVFSSWIKLYTDTVGWMCTRLVNMF